MFVGGVAEKLDDGALGLKVNLYHFLPAFNKWSVSLMIIVQVSKSAIQPLFRCNCAKILTCLVSSAIRFNDCFPIPYSINNLIASCAFNPASALSEDGCGIFDCPIGFAGVEKERGLRILWSCQDDG